MYFSGSGVAFIEVNVKTRVHWWFHRASTQHTSVVFWLSGSTAASTKLSLLYLTHTHTCLCLVAGTALVCQRTQKKHCDAPMVTLEGSDLDGVTLATWPRQVKRTAGLTTGWWEEKTSQELRRDKRGTWSQCRSGHRSSHHVHHRVHLSPRDYVPPVGSQRGEPGICSELLHRRHRCVCCDLPQIR